MDGNHSQPKISVVTGTDPSVRRQIKLSVCSNLCPLVTAAHGTLPSNHPIELAVHLPFPAFVFTAFMGLTRDWNGVQTAGAVYAGGKR